MCGITGELRLDGGRPDERVGERMVARLHHRGPDAQGLELRGPAMLGHTRLSIIDLTGGVQPMSTDDSQVTLTFNGEIFNHVELREELERLGHTFHTRSDTEVLLHSYLEWGAECVKHFNGQWAFAIWDAPKKRLFLSRDRVGIRPLFYSRRPGTFVFASEIKSLMAHPDVPRRIDAKGLDQVFTFWSSMAPRTVFEGVCELPAGCSMTVTESGDLHTERHWALDYGNVDMDSSEDQQAEELLDLLIKATRLRLERADVPVGAYVSGGLDSAVIAGIVRRHTDVHLKTFSIGFDEGEFDESSHQAQVIKYLDIKDHHSALATKDSIAESFEEVVWFAEQPLIRTAPAPLYRLSGTVREQGYKVVLTGEGSDETMCGYDLFKESKIRRFWSRHPESKLRPKLLRKLYPYMPKMQAQSDAYLKAFFFVRDEDLRSPFFSHLPRWELTRKIRLLYSADLRAELGDYNPMEELRESLPSAFGDWHPMHQAQFLETSGLMAGYLLSSQGDRMMMGHSIEGRFPFLDYRVVEFASRVHPDRAMSVLDEKALLKKAVGDLIPPFLRNRPKQPYRAPDSVAFFDAENERARAPWIDEALTEERTAQTNFFNPKAVKLLREKAVRGKIVGAKDGMALVGVLSAELIAHHFLRMNSPETKA